LEAGKSDEWSGRAASEGMSDQEHRGADIGGRQREGRSETMSRRVGVARKGGEIGRSELELELNRGFFDRGELAIDGAKGFVRMTREATHLLVGK
jgi:hypothetical protein